MRKTARNDLTKTPDPLFDIFAVVGVPCDAEQLKNISRERLNRIRPPAELLYVYPPNALDGETASLTELPAFCFPSGVKLSAVENTGFGRGGSSEYNEVAFGRSHVPRSETYVFIMTDGLGQTSFGVCVCVNALHDTELAEERTGAFKLVAQRAYCFLSKYPFLHLQYDVICGLVAQDRLNRLRLLASDPDSLKEYTSPLVKNTALLPRKEGASYDGPPLLAGVVSLFKRKIQVKKMSIVGTSTNHSRNRSVDWMNINMSWMKPSSASQPTSPSSSPAPPPTLKVMPAETAVPILPPSALSTLTPPRSGSSDSQSRLKSIPSAPTASFSKLLTSTNNNTPTPTTTPLIPPTQSPSTKRLSTINTPPPLVLPVPSPSSKSTNGSSRHHHQLQQQQQPPSSPVSIKLSPPPQSPQPRRPHSPITNGGGIAALAGPQSDDLDQITEILYAYQNAPIPLPGESFLFPISNDLPPVTFDRPIGDESAIVVSRWTLSVVFGVLPLEHILRLMSAALLERQIVVISSNLSISSSVVLSVISLLRPFVWQSLLCPVLPLRMLDFLDAPVPFLVGLPEFDPRLISKLEEIFFFHVDRQQIHVPACDWDLPSLPHLRRIFDDLKPYHEILQEAAKNRAAIFDPSPAKDAAVESILQIFESYFAALLASIPDPSFKAAIRSSNQLADSRGGFSDPFRLPSPLSEKRAATPSYTFPCYLEWDDISDRTFIELLTQTQMYVVYRNFIDPSFSWQAPKTLSTLMMPRSQSTF
mmetsp:Transcript_39776/g.64500  ORF Transcript_39776/g.64500 Transcript_39776/m.64500 type:complete len:758 (+) Transcript_39776:39-2312(+)